MKKIVEYFIRSVINRHGTLSCTRASTETCTYSFCIRSHYRETLSKSNTKACFNLDNQTTSHNLGREYYNKYAQLRFYGLSQKIKRN